MRCAFVVLLSALAAVGVGAEDYLRAFPDIHGTYFVRGTYESWDVNGSAIRTAKFALARRDQKFVYAFYDTGETTGPAKRKLCEFVLTPDYAVDIFPEGTDYKQGNRIEISYADKNLHSHIPIMNVERVTNSLLGDVERYREYFTKDAATIKPLGEKRFSLEHTLPPIKADEALLAMLSDEEKQKLQHPGTVKVEFALDDLGRLKTISYPDNAAKKASWNLTYEGTNAVPRLVESVGLDFVAHRELFTIDELTTAPATTYTPVLVRSGAEVEDLRAIPGTPAHTFKLSANELPPQEQLNQMLAASKARRSADQAREQQSVEAAKKDPRNISSDAPVVSEVNVGRQLR